MNSSGSSLKNLSFLMVFLHKLNENKLKNFQVVIINNDVNYDFLRTLPELPYNN
jgi:hypothetical protein